MLTVACFVMPFDASEIFFLTPLTFLCRFPLQVFYSQAPKQHLSYYTQRNAYLQQIKTHFHPCHAQFPLFILSLYMNYVACYTLSSG